VLPAYAATENQFANGYYYFLVLVHQLTSEIQNEYVILNSGNLGESPGSGLVIFSCGLAHGSPATPDAEQEILDEQGHYWLLGDHAHTNAATPFETVPQDNAWFTLFKAGEAGAANTRTIIGWAAAWGATWNTLGEDNTLYHMVPLSVPPAHQMEKHGSNPAFPTDTQSLTPQFTGVNP